ncbi:MAG: efflux RND transporter permease subunit [Gammaproteobacteria bacterium]|jgi:multidrug efflux pump|nr:efflux RND transporter permease subunit [Gammaproteobacteria bacterium]MBQ0775640.1 efflux RND transporter permease subunit [Gammaproteobacteria bacterium]
MNDKFNFSLIAIKNPSLTRYFFAALLLAGLLAYAGISRDEDPPFTFRVMLVSTYWPGASAQQMAQEVSYPLEKVIQEVAYVDKVRSYSKPGETTIFVDLEDATPIDDIPSIWYSIRKKVSDNRYLLPPNVSGPHFDDEFGEVFGIIYVLEAQGYTYKEKLDAAETVRSELLALKETGKVILIGVQDLAYYINASAGQLKERNLTPEELAAAVRDQVDVLDFGAVNVASSDMPIRTDAVVMSMSDLGGVVIPSHGVGVRLDEIATIEEGVAPHGSPKYLVNGREVIGIGVSLARGHDIIELGMQVGAAVEAMNAALPAGMTLVRVHDKPAAVNATVDEFIGVLTEAVFIVLLVSFLTLGIERGRKGIDWRPGLIVALTIPAVLAATFLYMRWGGIYLHKISLGALIIALGLLVDDAIIVVEMMVKKLEQGMTRLAASTYAFQATASSMLIGTIITALGFLPIGLATSTVGEYTYAIYAVTAAALLSSWFVSVYFVPFLGYQILEEKPRAASDLENGAAEGMGAGLALWCLENRKKVMAMTALAFAGGCAGMVVVEQQFFPDSNRPEILVDLWLPEGATLQASEALVRGVDAELRGIDGVELVSSFVGSSVPRFYLPIEQSLSQDCFSQLIVVPRDNEARDVLRWQLPQILSSKFPEARSRVQLLPNGPPVTYPIMFRVIGSDAAKVRDIASSVEAIVRQSPGTRNVHNNWHQKIKSMQMQLGGNQSPRAKLGVTYQQIANSALSTAEGVQLTSIWSDHQRKGIYLHQNGQGVNEPAYINGAAIHLADGKLLPLSHLGRADMQWEPGVMWRQNGSYAVTVQSEVERGYQPNTIAAPINTQLDDIRATLPLGYQIEVAGTLAESGKGSDSINANVPLMLFSIFTLLMVQLRSFTKSLLVFLTGPLGFIGATASLLISGQPMGFVAMLGVIALNGMIIRNALILVDHIEQEVRAGMNRKDAIIQAVASRFRPIMLTAITAVLAMIPLTSSTFWGPMATAMMGGLIVATLLTLFSLPAVYATFFARDEI